MITLTITSHGLVEGITEMVSLEKKIEIAATRAMAHIVQHAVKRARVNAPLLRGPLRASIRGIVNGQKVTGQGARSDLAPVRQDIKGEVVAGGAGVPYAVRQHEELAPHGIGLLNLGPVSSQQAMTVEGGVGGKFIERVLAFHLHRYRQYMRAAMHSTMVTGKIKLVGIDGDTSSDAVSSSPGRSSFGHNAI